MKKRVLSLCMAFVLSFSMMPMTAFAEGTDAVTEQQETQGSELPGTVDTTDGSATVEDISGGNAGTKDAAVEAVQALIDALPEEVTADNADGLQAQLMAINEALEALAALDAALTARLNMTRLENVYAALNVAVAAQATTHVKANHTDDSMTGLTDTLPDVAGSYYLSQDVTLDKTWVPADGTLLCLNGHNITMNNNVDVILVEAGVTFTLYDCNDQKKVGIITHDTDGTNTTYTGHGVNVKGTFDMKGGAIVRNTADLGGGVYVDNGGTFNMSYGFVDDNTAKLGGGVYVNEGGTLTMKGGCIGGGVDSNNGAHVSKDNTAESGGGVYVNGSQFSMTSSSASVANNDATQNGGGVFVDNNGAFTMEYGDITGSDAAQNGGGVYVNSGQFTMTGGIIQYNDAIQNGGGVYVNSGTFTMNDGTIENNTAECGGGVYYPSDSSQATFNLSGGSVINSNKKTDGTANNVYVFKSNPIQLTGELTSSACIRVSPEKWPESTDDQTVIVAKYNGDATTAGNRFFIDGGSSGCKIGVAAGNTDNYIIVKKLASHQHPICGDADCSKHGESVEWTAISTEAELRAATAGTVDEPTYYYLLNNVVLTENYWIPANNMVLCLNGNSIEVNAGITGIYLNRNRSFTLCDCGDNGKVMHVGKISDSSLQYESAVSLYYGSTFTMYGGIITNNISSSIGGAVKVGQNATFNMHGGKITGNYASKQANGAGVYVKGTGTFEMTGGEISNNTAWTQKSDINSYGTVRGAGVYVDKTGNVIVSGDAKIYDNYSLLTESKDISVGEKSADNVYLTTGTDGNPVKITVAGALNYAEIRVTTEAAIAEGTYAVIAEGTDDHALTNNDLNAFISDSNNYTKKLTDNGIIFFNGELHEHGICGKEDCSEAGHGNVAWIGVSTLDEMTSAGYYYLKNDITLNSDWKPADGVVLCLNGNSIKTAADVSANSISVNNTFTLTDCKGKDGSNYGQITNNTNIKVLQSGNFYFYGGSITGNSFSTNLSTGVNVFGNFYMHGGEIVNNTTTGKGGGVYLVKAGTFTMTGGRIANNSAKEGGGGVYVDSDTITVSSAAQIIGNKVVSDDGEASNNVYLPSGKKITVGGALNDSASIGVTSEAVPDDSTPVTIATAADKWIHDGNFTADSDFYKMTVSADGQTATLGLHEHQWKVRVKTGFDNILEEYCDVAGCTTAGGTLTLDADNQKYSGEAYDYAKCVTSDDWKHTSTMGEVYYTDSTDTKIDAPVKPGTYYANVTVDGVTAKRAFSIDRWKLSTSDFEYKAPDNLTYDGKAKEATVTSKKTGFGQLLQYTVLYFDEDYNKVENPTDADTYTVEVQVTQSDAYEAGQIMNSDWKFTIVPKPVTITGALVKDKVYDGTDKAEIKGTPAIEGLVDRDEADVMVDTSKAKATFEDANAGESKTVTFGGYALVGAKADNYKLSQPDSVTADIAPKELTIGDVTVADKAYDGKTEATITDVTFNGLVNSESLTKDRDYTVTGNFKDAAVGENKDVAVTVKLVDSVKNYTLSNTGYTKNGCKIEKAAVAAPAARDLTIINGSTTIYTVMLQELLPSLVLPQEYGNLTYDEPQLNITDSNSGYQGTAEVRRSEYEYGKLALKFTRTGNKEGSIGTITVTVHSDNYQDIPLTINILATAKIVPQLEGTLKLTPPEITYGEKLSNITISGTMTANGRKITGTFAWQNPVGVLNAGNQEATWKFIPEDTQTYAEYTGTTTVRVNKAEQSGAVLMYNYTYNETPKTPALTERKGDNNAAVTYYYSTTRTNSGGTEWKAISPTTLKAGTYYMYAVIGETGNCNAYTTEAKAFEVWKAEPVYTKPSGLTAKYGQKLSEITLPNPAGNMSGTWRWEAPDTVIDKTGTVSYGAVFTPSDTNYNEVVTTIEITVTPGDGRNLATEELKLAFNDSTDHTYTPDWSELPAGQTWNYACESSIGSGSNATLTKPNVSAADGGLTFAVSDGKAGDEITVILKACCNNYEDFTITLHIQITKAAPAGEPKYTLITTGGKTLADAGLTLNGSTLNPAAGTLEWVDADGNVLSGDTEVEVNKTYKWRFTPADTNYNTVTGEIELYHVDAPAISAQPKGVSVTVGEKATFEVTATGTDVTYQWKIDRNDGKGFVDITGATGAAYTTGVTDKDCNGFKYQCVISNAAGSVTTDTVVLTVKEKYTITATAGAHGSISPSGKVEVVEGSSQIFVITAEDGYEIESLTVDGKSVDAVTSYTFENVTAAHTIAVTFKLQYKIIDGANGSWTQSTDGSGSLLIRGNGEFSKFLNVKVDGNIIDPTNYEARSGSTIIELKAEYLKTLSEGTHTFEIAWTDGTAKTSFTVARNTPGSDDTGNNDNDDNNKDSNNDSSNNNSGSNTAGSGDNTAQTLTGSPNTGDASGLWIALFMVSAAGLAVMLVRRKNSIKK